ncbi:hypothetical protein [Tenacibaculum amylolyticum]|uniref:hypothetical protein n=1 Tax=Tenacibaculum amylolyticum TaxID=104269 RepID=UPI0038951F0D
MSKTISLNGRVTLTEVIESNVSLLAIDQINPNAKVKVSLVRENQSEITIIPNLKVGLISESQKKIESLSFMSGYQMPVSSKVVQLSEAQDDQAANVPCLKNTFIDLGVNGEIVLGENDQIKLTFKDLNKLRQSTVHVVEGSRATDKFFTYNSSIWRKSETNKSVDLNNVDYLVFDPLQLPDQIDIIVNGEKVVYTTELLLMMQDEFFGNILHNSTNNNSAFGYEYAVVLEVRGAQSVYFTKEEKATDYLYYTVKH